jgi:hypothetical protein
MDGWIRSDQEKADTFAEHFIKIFIPNFRKVDSAEEVAIFGRRELTQSHYF